MIEYSKQGNERREALASYAHGAWAGWMCYLFECSERGEDGSVTIPPALADRWRRQMQTPYKDLPADEKISDQREATKILNIVFPSRCLR